jgi:cytoskeletal protein RodZ
MNKLIGQQLQEAREAKSLTLEQVSREIRIRTRYLEALEEGNFGELPSAVHVRGFLRSYADFLDLNSDELLNALRHPQGTAPSETPPPAPEDEIPPPDSLQQAEAIFHEIGSTIQSRRDTLGLSLEDVEQYTHLQAHYAQMIENGQFTEFPSPVQARGMLSNYVEFLEMDTQAVMLRYAEALQIRLFALKADEEPEEPQSETTSRPALRLPQWLRNILSPDVAIFGTIGIFIVIFTIWGIGRILNTQSTLDPLPTAPSLADVLLPTSTPLPPPTSTFAPTPTFEQVDIDDVPPEEVTPTPTLPPITQAEIQLYVIVRQRAYLKVTSDGVVVFEGRVIPGTNLPYTGSQQIELLTGNAAALQVFFNDIDIGPLGILGEVTNVIFTRDGLIRPTPTPTPTLSLEQLVTPTPTTSAPSP